MGEGKYERGGGEMIHVFKSCIYFIKAAGKKASRLYELNLLAFVLNEFDFWSSKCPNYENIEF